MAQTPAQLKAAREFAKRRTEAGEKKSTFWLAPEHLAKIDAFRGVLGSRDAVVRAALEAYMGPAVVVTAVEVAEPASAPGKRAAVATQRPTPKPVPRSDLASHRAALLVSKPFRPHPKPGAKK